MKKIYFWMTLLVAAAPTALWADIVVQDAYVRATPPGQKVTGAFMLLQNNGEQGVAVVRAASDVANVVELHTHKLEDGQMKMRQIPQIDVAAGATTELKPGGLHIMLIDLKKSLQPGDEVSIEVWLDNDTQLEFTAPVKNVMQGMMQDHKTMMKDQKGMMKGQEGMMKKTQ